MIRINLLPAEYRQPEGPPPGRLAVIFVDLVVLGAAMSVFLPLLFIQIPNAREEKSQVLSALGAKLRDAKATEGVRVKLDLTTAETAAYGAALDAHRRSWSRELERLHVALGAERAWLESLRALPGAGFSAQVAIPRDDLEAVRGLCAALARHAWDARIGAGLAVETRGYDAGGARFDERDRLAVPLVLVPGADVPRGDGSGR